MQKASSRTSAPAAKSIITPPLPTMAQVIDLHKAFAVDQLERLIEIRKEDDRWCESELAVAVDFATELVLDKVRRIDGGQLADYSDFSLEWASCSGALQLCVHSFPHKESEYYRALHEILAHFTLAEELVELAEIQQLRATKDGAQHH